MKKLFAIAFTCVYLTLTVGVVHATHYCMGRVNSSSFFSFEAKKCVCDLFAAQDENSCCDDEVSLVKIDDDQSLSVKLSINPEFYSMGVSYLLLSISDDTSTERSGPSTQTKPPGNQLPLFVQHCSLVLYSDDSMLA